MKTYKTQLVSPTIVPQFNIDKDISKIILSPNFIILSVCLLFLLFLNLGSDGGEKLGSAFWGGKGEIARAKKKAIEQIKSPTRNSVTLYINIPRHLLIQQEKRRKTKKWRKAVKIKRTKAKTFYLPDCQRGTAVIGAAGSGKTFSVIDPLIKSSVDQGFPAIVYDFKYPAQCKRITAYALARGYKVRIFAPGFEESYTVNPLDFLKDEEDAVAAGQLAQTINKNMNAGGANKGGDKFFEQAGDSLVEGIFLLTKAVPRLLVALDPDRFAESDNTTPNKLALSYCDLMTGQAIMALPDIANRLAYAKERGVIGDWNSIPLSQVIATKDSEKTVASIVSTAIAVFQKFLKKDFIGAFVGDTDLNLDIDGKELVIFGLDRNNRDIVGPLLAAILHMTVSRNVSRVLPRKDPLCVFLDELPTMFLPNLTNWLNENREDGFVGVLGFQNLNQLEERYGKEITRTIVGGCGTKFIFNPQEPDSAKFFSEVLGDKEISYKTKSKSTAVKGGGSNSTNNNKQKKALFEPSEFNQLGTGRCVILNPNYTRKKKSYIPIIRDMKICPYEIAQTEWSKSKWEQSLIYLSNVNKNSLINDPDADEIKRFMMQQRAILAQQLFPLPPSQEEENII